MDGREKYPWGHSIGLGKGVIDGMTRTGSIPGGDTLSAIHRCENARIDWILDGRGPPYLVNSVTSDDDAKELLEQLLEERWRITIVTDSDRIALVLDQPGSFDVKDKKNDDGVQLYRTVPYTIVEIIAGIVGRNTMALVCTQAKQGTVRFMLTNAAVMTQLGRGRLGTWRLLNAPDAVLAVVEVIDAKHPIFTQGAQADLFPATKDEAALLDHYRALPPEKRLAVEQVATALAESPLKKRRL